jgi:hypothetical protein
MPCGHVITCGFDVAKPFSAEHGYKWIKEGSSRPTMFPVSLVILAGLSTLVVAKLHVHNSSFAPDQILRVTAKNITQGCLSRYSVLVNGGCTPRDLANSFEF